MAILSSLSIEVVPSQRLNDFVLVYIQRHSIQFVVDNYKPIREQYYEHRKDTDNHQQYTTMEGRS